MAAAKENVYSVEGTKEDLLDQASNCPSFKNVLNFRDVGKTVNDYLGEKRVAEGILFRSARPDDATLADRDLLKNKFGIKTVIDLRTPTEHANKIKRRGEQARSPRMVESNKALTKPLQIPGLNYLPINLNGPRFERSLLWQLSWFSIVKLIGLMILGYRMEAISILGREVMTHRGLVGLGKDSLDHCGPEILRTLQALSNPTNQPVLIHCTQGKDRTGLIILITLLLLKTPLDAITHDYLLSEDELHPEREARLKEIREIGLTDEFAGCPKNWVDETAKYISKRCGGVGEYVKAIGLRDVDEEALVKSLAVDGNLGDE